MYFDDGESVGLSDDEEEVRRQMDRLEDGAFDKYKDYLDVAQLNLEVRSHDCFCPACLYLDGFETSSFSFSPPYRFALYLSRFRICFSRRFTLNSHTRMQV